LLLRARLSLRLALLGTWYLRGCQRRAS
jgi:hypothetical protein